jgi:XTP/dITP diphosphohydrolase
MMKKILLATHNQGKIKELKAFLKPFFDEIISLKDLDDHDEVIEDLDTYEGNAIKKATYFYDKYHIPTLSDDSGIELNHIKGYPGIYSARIGKTDLERNQIILKALEANHNRGAKMISVIALIDTKTYVFRGEVEGIITEEMRGNLGFGYDSIFYVSSLGKTFGEVEVSLKSLMSHRGIALAACVEKIKEIEHDID